MLVRVQVPPSVQIKSQDESHGFFVSRKNAELVLAFLRGTNKRPHLWSCFFQDVEAGLSVSDRNSRSSVVCEWSCFFQDVVAGLTEGNSRLQYFKNP